MSSKRVKSTISKVSTRASKRASSTEDEVPPKKSRKTVSHKSDTIQITVTQPTIPGSTSDPIVSSGQPAGGQQTQSSLTPLLGQQPVTTAALQFPMWAATWQPSTQQYQMSMQPPPPQFPLMTLGTPQGLMPQLTYPWLVPQPALLPPQGTNPFGNLSQPSTVIQPVATTVQSIPTLGNPVPMATVTAGLAPAQPVRVQQQQHQQQAAVITTNVIIPITMANTLTANTVPGTVQEHKISNHVALAVVISIH